MKLIFLTLLISFSALAQYKVEVRNLKGDLTHGGEFATSVDAEKWIAEQEKQESWGKNERLKPSSEVTPDELDQVIETIPAQGIEGDIDYVPEMKKLKKTYSHVVFDISEEKAAEKAKIERKKLAKERIKNFDLSKIDKATTILGLKAVVKELITEIVEAGE